MHWSNSIKKRFLKLNLSECLEKIKGKVFCFWWQLIRAGQILFKIQLSKYEIKFNFFKIFWSFIKYKKAFYFWTSIIQFKLFKKKSFHLLLPTCSLFSLGMVLLLFLRNRKIRQSLLHNLPLRLSLSPLFFSSSPVVTLSSF